MKRTIASVAAILVMGTTVLCACGTTPQARCVYPFTGASGTTAVVAPNGSASSPYNGTGFEIVCQYGQWVHP
jgi:hypothetical protein